MTTTEKPEIGATANANGIKTNYLEGGTGDQTVMLIHGSGPGVTSYANWRLVIPALAEKFRVIAPDMVGFGYSERPDDVEYSVQTWADQVVGPDGYARHREGQSGRQQLRWRDRAAHRHSAPRPGRQAGADGQHGRAVPDHRGPRASVGIRALVREHAQGARLFAYSRELVNDELAQVRYEGSIQPGFQEAFSAMFPAPRQRWVDAMCTPEDEIRKLPHRTLIVHGREDQVIPVQTSLRLMELIDNGDLSVYSHCGHWSMIERNADFNRSLIEFFSS